MRSLCVVLILLNLTSVWAIDITVSEAPEDNLPLTLSAIKAAQKEILLNVYELTSPEICRALETKIEAGIHVEILEEGQPVGGFSQVATSIHERLAAALVKSGMEDHFYIMKSSDKNPIRRFAFDHAKYIVVDGKSVLIGSENYSSTGNPKPGTQGNRGWEVWVHDSKIADFYKKVFNEDTNTEFGDVTEDIRSLSSGSSMQNLPLDFFELFPLQEVAHSSEPTVLSASEVTPIIAPNTSLSGLRQLIEKATDTLDIEQMSFPFKWEKEGSESPILIAVESAARRGVKVRVLLNNDSAFHDENNQRKNEETIKRLNRLATDEHLKLEARIANLDSMKVKIIHNKGVLVDQNKTLISSINWTENAIKNNREAAVLIQSKEIFQHYESLFQKDWELSGQD